MTEKDTILINIMYTGDYTNKNIGHEIINLYKTDKGENYIYISPYGTLAEDKYDRVGTVLLARPACKGRLEIIAKAEDLTPLSSKNIKDKNKDGYNEGLKNYLDGEKIKYSNDDALKYYYIGQILTKNNSNNIEDLFEKKLEDIRIQYVDECIGGENKDKKIFLFKEICRDKGIDEKIIELENVQKFKDALKLEFYYKKLVENGYKEISDTYIYRNYNKILLSQQIKNLQYGFVYKQLTEKEYQDIVGLKAKERGNKSKIDELRNKYLSNIDNNLQTKVFLAAFEKEYLHKSKKLQIKYRGGRNSGEISFKDLSGLKQGIGDDKIEIKKYIEYFENTEVPNRWKKDIFIHKYHSYLINKDEIKYGGKYLDEIFTNNKYNDTTVHFTFKAGKVIRPKFPVYIKYTPPKNKKDEAIFVGFDDTTRTYRFEKIQFRNQKCMTYVSKTEEIKESSIDKLIYNEKSSNKGEAYVYAVLKNIIDSDYWVDEKTSDKDENKLIIKSINSEEPSNYKQFFLDITGNQYDELSYSNMFAYFFKKYPKLFEEFAKTTLLEIDNFEIGNYFEIAREENDIDILIKTENDVFVIENKIKSHINGEKYIDTETHSDDENSEDNKSKESDNKNMRDKSLEYTNQLIKYYNYVESRYPDRNRHYFIFKPNYNNTEAELVSKMDEVGASNEVKDITKKYKHVDYLKIHKFYENKPNEWLEENNNETIIDYVYFLDFVKALKRHISSTDNTIELEMEYKFRQAIEKTK